MPLSTGIVPYFKLAYGVDGAQIGVDASNPLPVSGAVTVTSGTVTVNALAAGANTIGQVRLTADAGQGAATFHSLISAATTNPTSIKASAGNINSMTISNLGASACFFKLFNRTTAPTLGTDTPVLTYRIPAGATISFDVGPFGIRLGTGIACAITGGVALLDTTAVALNEVVLAMSYT